MAFDSGDGEALARFIVEKAHIKPSTNTVRHNAFMPPSNSRLSVYWISGIGDAEIWTIGTTHVAPARGKPLLGRADLNSLHVYEESLRVEIVPVPHPRHADIIGWDADSTRIRLQAAKLAALAELHLMP